MPTPWKQKCRFRMLCGLIARQKLSLVIPGMNSLSHQQKWSLFDDHVQKHLEFQPEMKPEAFKLFMKIIAKARRTFKSSLK